MYTQTKTLELPFYLRINSVALFFILSAVLISIFVSYALLVNKTIMNVVAREKIQSSIASLSTSSGDLEQKYLALKSGVTINVAYSKGFQDTNPQFISLNQNIAYNSTN